MKKFLGSKTAILIMGGLSILVIIFLIASLGSLVLKPARPFTVIQETKETLPGNPPTWNGIGYLISFLVALIIILTFFLPPDLRKKFLWRLVRLLAVGTLVFVLFSRFGLVVKIQQPQEAPGEVSGIRSSLPTETPKPPAIPSVFTPPHISSWTSYFVALGLLLVITGVWVWLVWRRRKKVAPYEELAEIARTALDDIEAGRDWGDTILNSYQRMNKAVAGWRGIHRQVGRTPAEFAGDLVSAHLPGEAVNRLTVLFERVRYGDKKSTPVDIREAVDCLAAILEYCQVEK
jgi:hypothetical protein